MTNLRLIVTNDLPIREEKYPYSWLLHKNKETIEVHVRHESHNRALVIDKVVA